MSNWQPIETAPKDGTRIDIYAKCWLSKTDTFQWRRFPDCYWWRGDAIINSPAKWEHLDMGWWPTHWMPLPDPPKEAHK